MLMTLTMPAPILKALKQYLQTKMWGKIRIIDQHTVKYFAKMQSLQDHEDETTTTTTTTTKTTTTSKTKAKDKAAGSPKGNDYYDDDYYYDDYYYDDYYYDFDFSKMPPSFRPMRRTNGASKHLGFSFLLDPLLNDVYNNPQGDSLSNNFFEGFQVGIFFLFFVLDFCFLFFCTSSGWTFFFIFRTSFLFPRFWFILRTSLQRW